MYLPNCKFSFSGYEFESDVMSEITSSLRKLQSKSPSDSYFHLQMVNGEHEINGFLSINSSRIQFQTSHSGHNALQVVDQMNQDVLGQLGAWHSDREF